ncbi:MAG: hypothetical protein AAF713_18750 [Pseudomonadota bacterium]
MFLDPQKQDVVIALFAIMLSTQGPNAVPNEDRPATRDATFVHDMDQPLPGRRSQHPTFIAADLSMASPVGGR